MAASSPKPALSGSPALKHTSSGKPYLEITSRSEIPIYLTEFYSFDAAPSQAVLSQPAVNNSLVSVPKPYTLADAEAWVKSQLKEPSNLPLQVLRSKDPESGTFIGCVSLMPKSSDLVLKLQETLKRKDSAQDRTGCELGYYLDPAWQGRGIMSAGVRALLKHYVGQEGVGGVSVLILEENTASRAVVERMEGWVRQVELDDWVEWPLVKGGGRKKQLGWTWEG